MKQLLFATSNQNKKKEITEILGDSYQILSLSDLNIQEEIPEPFDTLEENSRHKATFLFKKLGFACFAEDTGLEVYELNMQPGVKSARYAGEGRSNEANIDLLLNNLKDKKNKLARFRTVISYVSEDTTIQFEGKIEGRIIDTKLGDGGFGYDPIFIPEGYEQTFAEMGKEIKNKISHRSIAIKKLIEYLKLQK